MAVRIQLRRDTAANWVANNPVLREGELGIETDTLKIKIGNGSAWNSISNYANVVPSDLNTTLGDYVTVNDIGAQGGVVGLNNSYNAIIPGSSIILEGPTADSYETTLTVTDPTADRTITLPDRDGTVITTGDTGTVTNTMLAGSIANNKLTNSSVTINGYEIALGASASYGTDNISEGTTNKYFTDERAQDATAAALAAGTHTNITVTYDDNANSISLAAAPGYVDEQAVDAVAAALAAGTHTNISVSYDDNANSISLTGAQTYSDENAQDAVGNAVGNGLDYDDNTGAISVDPSEFALSAVGAPSADVSMASYKITNLATPTSANDAANKAYVDNITAGLNFHAAVHAATTADLSATYNNEAGTLSASGAFPTIDGETILETERVLVKSQSDAKQNGIYVLTDDGDPSGTWVLTRATDADNSPSGEIAYGDFVFVQTGSANGGYGYIMTTTGTITLGTSNINWTQFNAGQTVIAGNGLTESSPGTLAINTGVTVDLNTSQTLTNKTITGTFTGNLTGNAGTVTNGVYTNAANTFTESPQQITIPISNQAGLIVKGAVNQNSGSALTNWQNSSGTVLATVTGSGRINSSVSVTAGSISTTLGTLTSIATSAGIIGSVVRGAASQTANLQEWQNSSGTVLTSISSSGAISAPSITLTNALATTSGGTGLASYTTGDILYASATNTLSKLAAGSNGQVLTLSSGVPTWAAAAVTYSAPTIGSTSIASGSTVTSISGLTLRDTSSTTVSANTATTVDTNALAGFTTVKYVVSIKQGSKIRSSQIIAQTDGTSVDYTEFGITETGGTMTGVTTAVSVSSTNAVLQVTITDAASTNATVKIHKVLI